MTLGNTGAIFSPDRKYRYALWRIWDSKPLAGWYMLNPSVADEKTDDPTIRKCCGFARRWGNGGILVLNLFNLVARGPFEVSG